MSIEQYFLEAFYNNIEARNSLNRKDENTIIFKSPTSKEMKEITEYYSGENSIRMGVNDNVDLFAWNGDVFHVDIRDGIKGIGIDGWKLRILHDSRTKEVEIYQSLTYEQRFWEDNKHLIIPKLQQAIPGLLAINNFDSNESMWKKGEPIMDDESSHGVVSDILHDNEGFMEYIKKSDDWTVLNKFYKHGKWIKVLEFMNKLLPQWEKEK